MRSIWEKGDLMSGALCRCIGYGTFLSTYMGSPLAIAYLWAHCANQYQVILSQVLYLLATSLGSILLKQLGSQLDKQSMTNLTRAAYVALSLCLLLCSSLVSLNVHAWIMMVFWFIMGLLASVPLYFWLDSFVHLYRIHGRGVGLSSVAAARLVSAGIAVLGWFVATSIATLLCLLSLLVFSLACLEIMSKSEREDLEAFSQDYRLTPYGSAALISSGLLWGLSASLLCLEPMGFAPKTTSWMASLLVAVAITVLFWKAPQAKLTRFGRLVRLAVGLSGLCWSAIPPVAALSSSAALALSSMVFTVQGITMAFFSIEMCRERGMSTLKTITVNYALFAASGAVAIILSLMATILTDGPSTWEIRTFIAVAAIVALLPFLPSSISDASAFAEQTLPEDESFDDTLARNTASTAAKYLLTSREREILERLMRGWKVQEVADDLSLSIWTVRDYKKSIYEKTGVHSAQDLMMLVSGGSASKH